MAIAVSMFIAGIEIFLLGKESYGLYSLAVLLMILLDAITTNNPQSYMLVTFLDGAIVGKYDRGAGPFLLVGKLFGIFKVILIPATTVVEEFPARKDQTFSGNNDIMQGDDSLRITTGKSGDPDGDALDERLTIGVSYSVRYRVANLDRAAEMYQQIGTREDVRDDIFVKSLAAITYRFGIMTTAQIITELSIISEEIQEKLQESIGSVIVFEDFIMRSPDLSHGLNIAMRDAVAELFKKKQTITEAEGTSTAITLKGAAEAEVKKAILIAESIGYKEMADALGIEEGLLILQMQTAKAALAGSERTIIAPEWFQGVMKAASKVIGSSTT